METLEDVIGITEIDTEYAIRENNKWEAGISVISENGNIKVSVKCEDDANSVNFFRNYEFEFTFPATLDFSSRRRLIKESVKKGISL